MMILVIGGSGSGKSGYAESRVMELKNKNNEKIYYIATMKVWGPEEVKIVKRHKKLRSGKGFLTIEKTTDVNELASEFSDGPSGVLLECTSNLVANEMFKDEQLPDENQLIEKVSREMEVLKNSCTDLVVVTNNIHEDGTDHYDDVTISYMRALGRINQRLAKMSDEVYEVISGVPNRLK